MTIYKQNNDMEKYNSKLVEEVRQGKAQVQAEKTKEHNDLLNFIFPLRNWGSVNIISEYFKGVDTHFGYLGQDEPFEDLPIIHASKFIEEVKWVLVSDDKVYWEKRILVADLGERFVKPILVVTKNDSDDYLDGLNNISFIKWKFMREIEEPKESEINKVLNEILKEYQENEFKSIVRIIKSKMTI